MTYRVETVSLDEYLSQRGLHLQFAKMDVEGAEGLVVRGMQETLRKDKPIVLLAHMPNEAVRLLKEAGYHTKRLHSVKYGGYMLAIHPRSREASHDFC